MTKTKGKGKKYPIGLIGLWTAMLAMLAFSARDFTVQCIGKARQEALPLLSILQSHSG